MKWYTYLICFILIFIGAFCGINLVKEVNSKSYINGTINDLYNSGSTVFYYGQTNVVFYDDPNDNSDELIFEVEVMKTANKFNAVVKEYYILMNNHLLYDYDVLHGGIVSSIPLSFKNPDGSTLCSIQGTLYINFYVKKTNIKIAVSNTVQASYLEDYFSNNGFTLSVVEID